IGPKDLIPNYAIRGAGGALLVAGAGQSGQSLAIDGGAHATLVLKAGDYIGLGSGSTSRFYIVLKDATTDGSGAVTLDLWPRLRETPADNAALVLTDPKGVFRMIDNTPSWDIDASVRTSGIGFSFGEA